MRAAAGTVSKSFGKCLYKIPRYLVQTFSEETTENRFQAFAVI